MSKTSKITQNIRNYVLSRKRKNCNISCRTIADETGDKFKMIISKSSVNVILKGARLSSPVGRNVAKIYRPSGETDGAGYAFLLAANYLLGFSRILATTLRKLAPSIRMKWDTLEAISEAWIMARAVYNVPLAKIENYNKNDLWFITGRKANKGLLKQYINAFIDTQHIGYQLVSEIAHVLQDVHYLKIYLADNTFYMLDGQLKSVWKDAKIPIDYCTTIDIANSYINKKIFGSEPFVVFNAFPETVLGDEISDFIFSIDGSLSQKRIRKIELIAPQGVIIKEIPFVVPERRNFILGIWPWQYKLIADLEKRKTAAKIFIDGIGQEFYLCEDRARFAQHANNIDVMLRLIVIKSTKDGPALLGVFTNADQESWTAARVVERYLRHWPDVVVGHKLFLRASKMPLYLEDFISSEKMFVNAKKINETNDPDAWFLILVEILNDFCKRNFFPEVCASWSLLKMRELFYKQRGFIKRDMDEDILFKLFNSNMLEEKDITNFASAKFNEANIFDSSGRQLRIISAA
ncbi:MAG: hypothetical protein AUJ74_00980 [Candidatus Omnitrophica bacterium CG1_02_44_16]|nr:MAG: hypothetical protein AUJ74_00980 [Candidatus Omnitrophica bacterium CG1_02_44_16]PIY82674.1 MAG: hypothetical protein COY78_05225 [Candidatus Omnitrophica bacterium CG_4_10_14_0_8_um_filter_44_12]PIZ84834.1 MAG: hypothetical protein COX96_01495 [Candidatus Omnitrophica bacterium CG_4_10_14_0_2_um_filter_44_9]